MSKSPSFFLKIGTGSSADSRNNDETVLARILRSEWIRMTVHFDKDMKDYVNRFCLPSDVVRTKEAILAVGLEYMKSHYDVSYHDYIHIYIWSVEEFTEPDGSYDS